ncbi:MAG: hypothetical protein IT210_05235 [Armatimonadetes bacterium]|nr:hypothetical protein [Armatimonadota bacterium]
MWRAVLLGIAAMLVVCAVVSYAELVTKEIQIGFLQLPPVVVAMLFFLILGNRVMSKISRRLRLSPQEIIVIYGMMLIASMISSRGLMEDILPTLVGINYYTNETNNWDKIYYPYIKPWMVPFDPAKGEKQPVSKGFYEGLHYGEPIPWGDWVVPLACWSILIGLVFFAFICLATILYRQWSSNEKLSFPLVQLPLEMARDGESGSFFSNRLTWLGFALPVFLFGFNGLHALYPSVPGINLQLDIHQYFTSRPWSDMGFTVLYMSLAGVGFFYLLPTELLLSLWLFFVIARLQEVAASAFGMEPQGMPHAASSVMVGYQTAGAYFVLALYFVYIARPHLKQVVKRAFGRGKMDDKNEMMPYSMAFWGLVGSFGGIVLWCQAAGMKPGMAVIEFGLYIFVQAIVMVRCTAEAGLIMTEGSWNPIDIVGIAVPKHVVGPQNLTVMAFTDALYTRDLRGIPLTGFMDIQKASDEVRARRRKLLVIIFLAILGAIVFAGAIQIWLPYRSGAINLYTYPYVANNIQFFRENQPMMEGSVLYDWQAPVFFTAGAVVTALLGWLRLTIWWWPLHPLGYAMSVSWAICVFWFPIFVAWVLKSLIVRYGGMSLYAKARPLFLGLIFGEFTMAVFWTVIAWIWNTPTPFFPWP